MWMLFGSYILLMLPWFISKSEIHASQSGGKRPTTSAALTGVLGLIASTIILIWAFWPFSWWQPLATAIIGSLVVGAAGVPLGRMSGSGTIAVICFSAGVGLAWRLFTQDVST